MRRARAYLRPLAGERLTHCAQGPIHVDVPLAPGQELTLPAAQAQHVVRVLRMQAGNRLTIFNGDGRDYAASIISANAHALRVQIQAATTALAESPLHITLAQALARGEKMDWIVQKATELGVAQVSPLLTERSEVHLDPARAEKRLAHWRAIALGACEQCGRSRPPSIQPPAALCDWLASLPPAPSLRLALRPGAGVRPRALQPSVTSVVLAVGPEGGFGERDLAALDAAEFQSLVLGPRVLRTETAGVAAVAALQALFGDL